MTDTEIKDLTNAIDKIRTPPGIATGLRLGVNQLVCELATALREANNLRKLVEEAYSEGWVDAKNRACSQDKAWRQSDSKRALGEEA